MRGSKQMVLPEDQGQVEGVGQGGEGEVVVIDRRGAIGKKVDSGDVADASARHSTRSSALVEQLTAVIKRTGVIGKVDLQAQFNPRILDQRQRPSGQAIVDYQVCDVIKMDLN